MDSLNAVLGRSFFGFGSRAVPGKKLLYKGLRISVVITEVAMSPRGFGTEFERVRGLLRKMVEPQRCR